MNRTKLCLLGTAAAAAVLLGGCRSANGTALFDGTGAVTPTPAATVSSTLDAARAEIANNTSETSLPRDTTTIPAREDNPETSVPVAVSFN